MIRKTYFELVHEMLKKTFSQSNWEKERVKEHNQRQQKEPELTRFDIYNQYLEARNRVVSLSPSVSNKTPLRGKKRIVNLVDKNKRLNLHFEYDKTFVPKPGQVRLGYIESLASKLRTSDFQNALYNANSATTSPRQSQQEVQDWLPFTRGKSRDLATPVKEREPENLKPQSPLPIQKIRNSNGITPIIARRKASGGMHLDFTNFSTHKNSPLASLALAKPLSETREYPKKMELPVLSEIKTERKSMMKIPRLQLEGKVDSPIVSPRLSPTATTARVQILKNKIGLHFDVASLVKDNGVYSPISIKSMEHNDSQKDTPKSQKDTGTTKDTTKDAPLIPTKPVSCNGTPTNQGHKMSKFSFGLQNALNKQQKNAKGSENFGDLLAKLKQDNDSKEPQEPKEPKDTTAITSKVLSPRLSLAKLSPRLRKMSLTGLTPQGLKFSGQVSSIQSSRIEYVSCKGGESPRIC